MYFFGKYLIKTVAIEEKYIKYKNNLAYLSFFSLYTLYINNGVIVMKKKNDKNSNDNIFLSSYQSQLFKLW